MYEHLLAGQTEKKIQKHNWQNRQPDADEGLHLQNLVVTVALSDHDSGLSNL